MTERSSDIEFDFFDEPPTEEAPRFRLRGARGDGRGGRPPRRPPDRPRGPAGLTPVLRIAGAVAIGIVFVVAMTAWIQGCRSDAKRDTYRQYMEALSAIASDSEQVGEELNAALTTPGIQLPELRQKLGNLAQQQEQDVVRARELTPPGRLRIQHQQAVEALQFRVSGLRRVQDALQQTAATTNPGEAGALLAEQMRRLVASDVIWEDQFMEPAIEVLRAEQIGGVEVPDSNFLPNPELASERTWVTVWERLQGAATGDAPAGLHGNALVSVRALPANQVLTADEPNTVTASPDLAFEATVENSGESQEVRVRVTLELDQSPRPIQREQVIDLINPGERKTVVFRDLGQIVQFQQEMTMTVEVAPVPGEARLENNSATYTVTFSLS
ncbi:MAG TPA: hypothetical protein VM290_05105 [Gaiellaceae bacterium]|nr:hypothetical protein [Gaiellaceae bacterium]